MVHIRPAVSPLIGGGPGPGRGAVKVHHAHESAVLGWAPVFQTAIGKRVAGRGASTGPNCRVPPEVCRASWTDLRTFGQVFLRPTPIARSRGHF